MNSVYPRLSSLRSVMNDRGYDALIVPRADEYLGEYIPADKERLRWVSGFSGSAGAAVVALQCAAIFTDGRYTVQVRREVDAELFSFHSLLEEPLSAWLKEHLSRGSRVSCDPRLLTLARYNELAGALASSGIELVADADNLVDQCWHDRPAAQVRPAVLLDESFSGESSYSKRQRMGKEIAALGADAALVFAPDSVSWLLNIRGRDIPKLPVVQAHALLRANGHISLLIDAQRVPEQLDQHAGGSIAVLPDADVATWAAASNGLRIVSDPDGANAWLQQMLVAAGATLVPAQDPIQLAKACKNAVELDGSRRAHIRDAVAVVRFLRWLDESVENGDLHDEAVLADELLRLRAQGEYFQECSFDTISAAGANAAMCHYNHLNGQAAPLEMNSVYLVDSGGQYTDGTTDITRTVAIGDPGAQVRRLFTLVLKGHIALDTARFPPGTCGTQLDALARQYLWQHGLDYDHGTGHGVGVYLSVHEGPQRIAKQGGSVALAPGMIVSNEPGYYRDGEFGMRCENLVFVRESGATGERPMLSFEALTLVPFDRRLIDVSLLRDDERDWIDRYHARVAETLAPLLGDADLRWLHAATQALQD
tara:strand:- start:160050 stop:161834 length:1785 start_codon:yes stop_codon:yes gene_type:complete